MSYYGAKGDFYSGRTGYYRGDPGFFSSIAKLAGGVINAYTGGALGGLLGGGGGSPPPQPTISAAGSAGLGLMGAAGTQAGRMPGMGARVSGVARTLRGRLRAPAGAAPAAAGMAHAHRLSHLARFGTRKRPSMNVTNPRALRRAIRRAKGFEKLALRSIRLVSPHRLHGKRRGGFKIARRWK